MMTMRRRGRLVALSDLPTDRGARHRGSVDGVAGDLGAWWLDWEGDGEGGRRACSGVRRGGREEAAVLARGENEDDGLLRRRLEK